MKLLTREVERVEIGERLGTPVVARVERRALNVSIGRPNGGLTMRLERLRPVAIEAGGANPRELSLEVSMDPWLRAVLGMLVVWLLSVAVTVLASHLRGRTRG